MPDSSPSPRRTFANYWLDPKVLLAVYLAAALAATLWKLRAGPFDQSGIVYQPLENFAIFRNSFYHLIHHQNLYAPFRFEQWDFFRYSPAFALLFAPFALLPYAVGATLWNLVNAAALYLAIRGVPGLEERSKMLALWFVFLAMLNSVENAQSNALMAALMIGAWSAQHREKSDLAGLYIALAAFIKIFGIFALVPCLLARHRRRLLAYTAAWIAVFALLPLVIVSFGELGRLYRNWYGALRAFNEARLGISFMGFLHAWLRFDPPANYVAAAGAVVLIVFAMVGRNGLLALASVLIYVTIFNYAAESSTYVIAVTGVALWYFSRTHTPLSLALLVATFLFAMVSSTDLVSRGWRREFLDPYVIKALPCILVWIKIQWDSCVILKFTHATGSR